MDGWIKLHRKILEWEWYSDANTFRLFIHLLLKANHQDTKWRGITIKRGQVLTSIRKLAKELKLTEKQIRGALQKLKRTHEVAHQPTALYSIITIKNFDRYQEKGTQKGTERAHERANEGHSKGTATNKNDKNEKNKKNILYNNIISPEPKNFSSGQKSTASHSQKKAKINFNFETGKWENITEKDKELWREAYPACDIKLELAKMADWLLSNPDKKKKNYRRFITNWLSRTQEKGGSKVGKIKSNATLKVVDKPKIKNIYQ